MELATGVSRFIEDVMADAAPGTVDLHDDLLESGILDSAGIAQLIAFLEDEYGVLIGDGDLTAENFGTIAAIVKMMHAKVPTRGRDAA